MKEALRHFLTKTNFNIMVALKAGVTPLELVSALEQISADMEDTIEKAVAEAAQKKDKPDA